MALAYDCAPLGNNLVHVSSPSSVAFLAPLLICPIKLSSRTSSPSKLFPASEFEHYLAIDMRLRSHWPINAGTIPVVRAFSRWKVVVGASAIKRNNLAFSGSVLIKCAVLGIWPRKKPASTSSGEPEKSDGSIKSNLKSLTDQLRERRLFLLP